MSNLYPIKVNCDDCHAIIEAFCTAMPNPDKEDWYRGFLCIYCVQKRKNARYWSDL